VSRHPLSVTVVIPTKNRRHLLQEALNSVYLQSKPVAQCVVVNDGSQDDTSAFLDALVRPGLVGVSVDESVGRSKARNLGLDRVSTETVLFLDDDDKLEPNGVENLLKALTNHHAAACAVGGRVVFDESGRCRRIPSARHIFVQPVWPEVLAGWYAVSGQCLFRTDLVRQVGGWDEALSFAEDQDLLLRTSRLGSAVLIPEIVLGNRIHGSNRNPPVEAVERAIRDRYVAQLDETERRMAERFVTARDALSAASEAYRRSDYREALRWLDAAMMEAPDLAGSPIVGRGLSVLRLKYRVGAVLGRRLSLIAKQAGRSIRRIARLDPGKRVAS
jgi:glycosyltransferase involved in cell wall biosynthesis